jgi:hypothetical protein
VLLLLSEVFILRTFGGSGADLLWHFAEAVYVLRTFGREEDPNCSPFTVLDHFFITSSVREKYEGLRMLNVRKHLP